MKFFKFHKCGALYFQKYSNRIPKIQNVYEENKLFLFREYCHSKPRLQPHYNPNIRSTRNYVVAAGVLSLGLAFASVPLYRIFCQASGFGGTAQHDIGGEKIENLKKVPHRKIKIKFNSDVSTNMKWKFKPQQKEVKVVPGETALAFYTATNPLDYPIVGISTYNILPYEAAPYFNKIQCFCFEEQRLNPKEQVDMPVFFYIDPEFCEDPAMEYVDEIILSYTFFQAKENSSLESLSLLPNKNK